MPKSRERSKPDNTWKPACHDDIHGYIYILIIFGIHKIIPKIIALPSSTIFKQTKSRTFKINTNEEKVKERTLFLHFDFVMENEK